MRVSAHDIVRFEEQRRWGHHISAVLLRGVFDRAKAREFDLQPISLSPEITLFPLCAAYCDFWAERLQIFGHVSARPLLNSQVIHYMVNVIALDPLFAVIETIYVGGHGSQSVAGYRGMREVMAPEVTAEGPKEVTFGPINNALMLLGVNGARGQDPFETIGLPRYRDFYDLFEAYEDAMSELPEG